MRRVALLLLFLFSTRAFAASTIEQAMSARNAGRYDDAAALLRSAVREHPEERSSWVMLGETLGWAGRFDEAERVYREALRQFPHDRALTVGYAQVASWNKHFEKSTHLYRSLIEGSDDDLDALIGAARNEYWLGDYRNASAHAERVVAVMREHEEARQILAGIHASTRPEVRLSGFHLSDDQPLQRASGAAEASLYSDPSTRWTATVGAESLNAGDDFAPRSASAERAMIGATTRFGSVSLSASIGGMRFPDETTRILGSAALACRLGPGSQLAVAVDRRELLATATALRTHPYVTTASLVYSLREPSRWLAGATASALSYFDDNSGVDINGYILTPVTPRSSRVNAWLGAAASYRDTDESRFAAGVYDPYWTPSHLTETRAVAAANVPFGRATIHVHADGGIARDRIPDPVAGFLIDRTFHPWRGSLAVDLPLGDSTTLNLGFEHNVTVFYAADQFNASLARRF